MKISWAVLKKKESVTAKTSELIWTLKLSEKIEPVDKATLKWKGKYLETVQNSSKKDDCVLPYAERRLSNISSDAIFFYPYLIAGEYLLIFLYTILMLT